jgi:hypothetical protein
MATPQGDAEPTGEHTASTPLSRVGRVLVYPRPLRVVVALPERGPL